MIDLVKIFFARLPGDRTSPSNCHGGHKLLEWCNGTKVSDPCESMPRGRGRVKLCPPRPRRGGERGRVKLRPLRRRRRGGRAPVKLGALSPLSGREGELMKLVLFNDYRLGVIQNNRVVDA